MSYETWHKHFDEDPDEEIGRYVTGAFGEPMLIVMPRISWAYVDWMESEHGTNVNAVFQKNQKMWTPEFGCKNVAFRNLVHKSFLKMEKKEMGRPEWCDPASPEDLLDI
ncbi:hypothetical protein [Phaeobacter sp. 11ANDIMAR09]|uniref:hypothetical protein n=1 Tax=Phaeobacter sp. 11ANDIMAR09 TaxID=1225647 RepID=UPI0006C8D09B|nr:hypothetical protein [Phaeobacter sp. 11ANDIMAR09]KPD13152.1 hypothetical protein AN476_07635 [Phaeobacter sp. 11ANDIMAR09]